MHQYYLPQHQQRPLVFVAHSMGGIIVKKVWNMLFPHKSWPQLTAIQAFNISHVDNERYGAIRRAVPAIVFLATPHRGSEYTEFFAKLARVVNVPLSGTSRYTGKTRANLIKSLGKHSKTLSDISEDFRQHTEDRKIYSFLEQASTPPLHEKVSATFPLSCLLFLVVWFIRICNGWYILISGRWWYERSPGR